MSEFAPQHDTPPAAGPRTPCVWELVTRPGVYGRIKAIAEAKKADWLRPSWSAADVTHQAVERLAAQRTLPDPADRAAFDAAFRLALHRTLHDRHRRNAAAKRGFGRDRVALDGLPARPEASPASEAEAEAEARQILAGYEAHRPRHALVLWMRAVHEFSYAEVAEALGLTLDQVKSALRLARAELRELLSDHERRDQPGRAPRSAPERAR